MEDTIESEYYTRNLVLSVCDLKQHGDVPQSRCCAASVTIATRMYFFGGADECTASDDLHLLEIEQMKWTQLTPTGSGPSERYGHSMVAWGQHLLVLGGLPSTGSPSSDPSTAPFLDKQRPGPVWNHLNRNPDTSFHMLDTSTLVWTKLEAKLPARCFHNAIVCGDKMLVFGGLGTELSPLNDLWSYDLNTQEWRCLDDGSAAGNPGARFGHQGCHIPKEEAIYIFGGHDEDSALHSWSLITSTWSQVECAGTAPRPRKFHTVDLIGNRVFVFAGLTSTETSDLYILDINNNRWGRPLYEGQLNVRAHASAILHDKLIIFGGVREKPGKRNQMEQKISKKLFFLNVLEIKDNVSEGDFKFKLVTVGDSGVGKSCLLTRFVQDYYSDFHVSTIGVDFKTVVTMVKGRLVKLQLWDTAGQERFSVVTGNYYRNSDGFIFVFDATNRISFDHIDQWLEQVKQHHECGPSTIKVLAGNKCDLPNIEITEGEAKAKADELGAVYIGTSAKTASNVDMAFLLAAQRLVELRRQNAQQQPKAMQLSDMPKEGGGGGAPACCAGASVRPSFR